AALTKGLTALLTESMVTAEALGVTGALRAELADSQPQFLAGARRGLPAMIPKAYRWVAEMEEIADTFAGVGLTPRMLEGAADVYRLVESAGADGGRSQRLLVGASVREMVGRTAAGMMTVRPMRDGVITDLESARAFIVAILKRVARRPWERLRPEAVIGVPAGATALERRAL